MNEISPAGIAPANDAGMSIAGGGTSPLPVLVSLPFNEVVSALALAMLSIKPPRKNKHVVVRSKKTGAEYAYDYATLDEILSVVTRPLAQNGLVLIQPIISSKMIEIVLLHSSGQWMKTPVPLMPKDDGFQDFSGAVTQARRIGIQALLSLSAEDDNDGNANAGNDMRLRHWDSELDAEQVGLHPLIRTARAANSIDGGADLLEDWNGRGIEMGLLKTKNRAEWDGIVAEVKSGLLRCLGRVAAAAWVSALIAETPEQDAAIRAKWDGEWADTLSQFRDGAPAAFGHLMRHMEGRRSAIEVAACKARAADTPTNRDMAIAQQAQAGTGFVRLVLDAYGEAASDEFVDPVAWANAFAALRSKTLLAERGAMDVHNMDAIADATRSLGADIILRDVFDDQAAEEAAAELAAEPFEIPTVEVPLKRGGAVDIIAYVSALLSIINRLCCLNDFARFDETNGSIFRAQGMPLVVQSKVLTALAGRKRALGIPLPSDVT